MTHYLYLVHARLPEHGERLSDRSRCAAETIPDPRARLGSVAKPYICKAEGFPSRECG